MKHDYQAVLTVPFGALGIRLEQDVLAAIDFLPASTVPVDPKGGVAEKICQHLNQYLLNPNAVFDSPLSPTGTTFQQRVWRAIQAIPVGETLTYAELARLVSSGPRAVASACGANPIPIIIPCHRVVAKGGLGGFMQGREAGSLSIKQWLLAHERNEPRIAG